MAAAFVSGLLFALGLVLSGMTQPAKIIGFLDLFGRWDPSLAFVMAGAIAVHLPVYRLVARRRPPFAAPGDERIDAALVGGAALFGVGWGLAGYCPGPAVVAAVSGQVSTLVFVASMAVGMLIATRVLGRASACAD